MDDEDKPDAMEKGIRFGCGFLFGAVWGTYLLVDLTARNFGTQLAWAAGAAALCGFLALCAGDRFWDWACEFAPWFRRR